MWFDSKHVNNKLTSVTPGICDNSVIKLSMNTFELTEHS